MFNKVVVIVKRIFAVLFFITGAAGVSLYVETNDMASLIIGILFILIAVLLWKKPKKKKDPMHEGNDNANRNVGQKKTEINIGKPAKKYYTFNVAGTTFGNDHGDNIQSLIKEYVKEQLEFEKPYNGLKNQDILDEYSEGDKIYEAAEIYISSNELSFEFEPTNEYDPNAIKVIHRDMGHIGYVPRSDNERVGTIIKRNNYSCTGEIVGGKYKYINEDYEVKIDYHTYGIEVDLSY